MVWTGRLARLATRLPKRLIRRPVQSRPAPLQTDRRPSVQRQDGRLANKGAKIEIDDGQLKLLEPRATSPNGSALELLFGARFPDLGPSGPLEPVGLPLGQTVGCTLQTTHCTLHIVHWTVCSALCWLAGWLVVIHWFRARPGGELGPFGASFGSLGRGTK